jgi:hypothetical protein
MKSSQAMDVLTGIWTAIFPTGTQQGPYILKAYAANARKSWAATSSSVEATPDMDHAGVKGDNG